MPDFRKDPFRKALQRNVYLRSTRDLKLASRTFAADTMPFSDVDGHQQKVLQPGTVLATITSGADIGKVGVYQSGTAGVNEVQTLTEGTALTAGTFTLTVLGEDTADLAFNASAAAVQTAIRNAVAGSGDADVADYANEITVTGGPIDTAPLVVTFVDASGQNVGPIVVNGGNLTGTITVAETTPGSAGATDGRNNAANIVGLCNTFLPWQLLERDVEVAVLYDATVIQQWCIEFNQAGQPVALGDATANEMFANKNLNILFQPALIESE